MNIPDRVRTLNLKLTPQRLAVIAFLEGNEDHPSALDVYKAVLHRFPTISFATVYNILEALREQGFVKEITIDRNRKRFDPQPERHHHLICTVCKRVRDVRMESDPLLCPQETHGFQVTGVHVDFYGICPQCRRQGSAVEHTTTLCKGR